MGSFAQDAVHIRAAPTASNLADGGILPTHRFSLPLSGRHGRGCGSRGWLSTAALDAGDVGGEQVDAVAVEVAAGAVVVLGGAWVGVPGEDLRIP